MRLFKHFLYKCTSTFGLKCAQKEIKHALSSSHLGIFCYWTGIGNLRLHDANGIKILISVPNLTENDSYTRHSLLSFGSTYNDFAPRITRPATQRVARVSGGIVYAKARVTEFDDMIKVYSRLDYQSKRKENNQQLFTEDEVNSG